MCVGCQEISGGFPIRAESNFTRREPPVVLLRIDVRERLDLDPDGFALMPPDDLARADVPRERLELGKQGPPEENGVRGNSSMEGDDEISAGNEGRHDHTDALGRDPRLISERDDDRVGVGAGLEAPLQRRRHAGTPVRADHQDDPRIRRESRAAANLLLPIAQDHDDSVESRLKQRRDRRRQQCADARRQQHLGPTHPRRAAGGEDDPGDHRSKV